MRRPHLLIALVAVLGVANLVAARRANAAFPETWVCYVEQQDLACVKYCLPEASNWNSCFEAMLHTCTSLSPGCTG
jgi:hypothetical protein